MPKHRYSQYAIENIRKEFSIKKYLESKNIFPVRNQEHGRASYICPIHKDTDPSFHVWQPMSGKYDYENYKCFGCKSGNCIISLVAALDFNGSWGMAVKYLADKLDISIEGEIDYIINDLIKSQEKDDNMSHDSLESLSLKISAIINEYLSSVNNDPKEMSFCEEIYKLSDHKIWSYDEVGLKKIYDYIVSNKGLIKRKKQWKKKNKVFQ